MAVIEKPDLNPLFVSPERRAELLKIYQQVNAKAGITGKPTMTVEELHASQIASGVRAEDNLGSRELLRMRYGDDHDQDAE